MSTLDPLAIQHELLRIGVDLEALGGLATSGEVSADDMLAWLRKLPTGLGHQAFLDRLITAGPGPGEARDGVPLPDPGFLVPDLDALRAFLAEIERVLPADLRGDEGWAITPRIDRIAAIDALRRLPDRAGWEAVQAVIPIGRVRSEPT